MVRECYGRYQVTQRIGLRNSSNMGEKANDLLVATRQKHNGMSWSNSGSFAFATVAATHNGELEQYIYNGRVSLQLPLVA